MKQFKFFSYLPCLLGILFFEGAQATSASLDQELCEYPHIGTGSFTPGENQELDLGFLRAVWDAPSSSFTIEGRQLRLTKMGGGALWEDLKVRPAQDKLFFEWGTDPYGVCGWRYNAGSYSVWHTPLETVVTPAQLFAGFVNLFICEDHSHPLTQSPSSSSVDAMDLSS